MRAARPPRLRQSFSLNSEMFGEDYHACGRQARQAFVRVSLNCEMFGEDYHACGRQARQDFVRVSL